MIPTVEGPPASTDVAVVASARALAEDAARAVGLELVEVHAARDASALVAVLGRVWSIGPDADLIDVGTVVALAHSGHYVVQARVAGDLVGGGIGFFGAPGDPLHSHIVGILPAATTKGVGRAIKLHQRAWCLQRGVTAIQWTYDPLVARNAHFNIRSLGALPQRYLEDFYGPMRDGINAGQQTDRVLVRWDLHGSIGPTPSLDQRGAALEHVALAAEASTNAPGDVRLPPPAGADRVLVGVPRDVESLRRTDPGAASAWRTAVRTALAALLAEGWRICDFDAGSYVLDRLEAP